MNRVDLWQFDSDLQLAAQAAAQWLDQLAARAGQGAPYSVALSGGRITKSFFKEVVHQSQQRALQFTGVDFFWADERCVPPTDSESNFATAQELLFSPVGIPASQIHRIPGELAPDLAAQRSEEDLNRHFRTTANSPDTPTLDLIFLGMGEDGHVASLFPGDVWEDSHRVPLFRPVVASKPPPHRITMSYRLIRAAREVWVLASGVGKHSALASALLSPKLPLGKVRESRAQLRIFSDIRS